MMQHYDCTVLVKYNIKLPLKMKVNRTNAAWNYRPRNIFWNRQQYIYIHLFTKMQGKVILKYNSCENVANLTYIRQ